ncbi:MAG TPA: adenylate/guanylate cyclase domain-containing protein, partial [Acidimicrobiia bacterium]|nr:adenylate/guanylate cyclase domain-containing protein [Acidimicrobiia bacterium]
AVRRLPETERFSELYLDDVAAGTREVSILFADLQGFTSFSETHAPGDVQAMLNEYFEAVLPPVTAIGGRVDRFIGDAVMVTFNVATEQPDHAALAARAGLALQEAAAPVVARHPDWPRFRVGINTGPAQVGIIGGGDERGYTVLGDTVNVASRIEGLAPAGRVAIGGGTLRALTGARVSHLGSMPVKGRAEPVEVWCLDGVDDR